MADIDTGVLTTKYWAWTEWYPAPQVTYSDFDLVAGDVITIEIVGDVSKTAGKTYMRNQRTGQEAKTVYGNESTPLCLNAAEWVVESEMIFATEGLIGERTAGYRDVYFQNARWNGTGGVENLAIADDMFNMVQNETLVATAEFVQAGEFKVVDTTPSDWNPHN